jgi:hypothetical protein
VNTYPLSFAQKSLLRAIHRAGGTLTMEGRSRRVASKLAELGLVEVSRHGTRGRDFRMEAGLTAAGLGVAGNLVGEATT